MLITHLARCFRSQIVESFNECAPMHAIGRWLRHYYEIETGLLNASRPVPVYIKDMFDTVHIYIDETVNEKQTQPDVDEVALLSMLSERINTLTLELTEAERNRLNMVHHKET